MSSLALRLNGGTRADDDGRPADDFYPTPPMATEALLRAESFEGDIWEPACGNGAISKVLEAAGYRVASTDLNDRQYGEPRIDFLMERTMSAANIVTNPPYGLAEQFVRHALDRASAKVAMLLRLQFLEGGARRKLFAETPLASVHVFSKRIQLLREGVTMSSGGMIAFAWFVWDHGHTGKPTLGWI